MSLIKYVIRRIIIMIPVLFGVITMTFIFSRLMPGDPVRALLAAQGIPRPTPHVYKAMVRQLGLDQPIIIQYFRYIRDIFTGNWGKSVSIARYQDVWPLVMQRVPRTIDLAISSILISVFVGIRAGVISATNRNKSKDNLVRTLALIGVAAPIFVIGMLLQYIFGYVFPIFPATGYKSFNYEDPPFVTGFYIMDALIAGEWYKIWDYLWHLTLPLFCLSIGVIASITRQTRSSMLEVLNQDFVRTAEAKGCTERDTLYTHALKNALIPTVTVMGLQFASLISGVVLIESTFALYGLGDLLVKAIDWNDYWVLSAVVFLITLFYITITLIIDVIHAIIDPRIRY